MSIITVTVPVPLAGDGPAVDVSALVGPKTVQLSGNFRGSYDLLASQDGADFVAVASFDAGGDAGIEQTVPGAFRWFRLRANAEPLSPVACEVSAVLGAGENGFGTIASLGAGFSGLTPTVDTATFVPPTGSEVDTCFICRGTFQGQVVVLGSLDGLEFNPVGSFSAGVLPGGLPAVLEFAPLTVPDKVRYVRLQVLVVTTGPLVVTMGGRVPATATVTTTLSEAYANGVVAADQTLVLLDARGGALVVDGTSPGFTGTYAVVVRGSEQVTASLTVGTAASPTARLQLPAGTAAAGTSPLKVPPGVLLAAKESGAVESDGTNIYWTDTLGTRWALNNSAAETLAQAYAAGAVAADQTLALLDAKGGALVVDGTSGSFTGAYAVVVKGNLQVNGTYSLSVGVATPTARLHPAAGTAAASTAPLKVPSGVVLSVTEPGAVEADASHVYWTNAAGARLQLDNMAGTETLATAYASGSVAADQTMVLLDVKGGGVSLDGTGAFTGTALTIGLQSNQVGITIANAGLGASTDILYDGSALHLEELIFRKNTSGGNVIAVQNLNLVNSHSAVAFRGPDNIERGAIGFGFGSTPAIFNSIYIEAAYYTGIPHTTPPPALNLVQTGYLGGVYGEYLRLSFTTGGLIQTYLLDGVTACTTQDSATGFTTITANLSAGDVLKLQNTAVDGYSTLRLYDSGGGGKAALGYGNASSASFTGQVYLNASAVPLVFSISGSEKMRVEPSAGRIGIGVAVPTAVLHLKATTATASTASLKIPPGTVLLVPEAGAVEADNDHLYWTNNVGTRLQLDNSGVTTTLAQAYANGAVAADQTLSLLNAKGGSLVLDGTGTLTGAALVVKTATTEVACSLQNPGVSASTDVLYDTTNHAPAVLLLRNNLAGNALALQNIGLANAFSAVAFRQTDGVERGAVGFGNNSSNAIFNSTYVEASYFTGSPHTTPPAALNLIQTGYQNGSYSSRLRLSLTSAGLIQTFLLDGVTANLTQDSTTGFTTIADNSSANDVLKLQNLAVDGYSTLRLYDSGGNGKAAFGYGNASALSFTSQVYVNASAVPLVFSISGSEKMRVEATAGRVGIGVTAPTAVLHLKAVTASANTASLKIDAGTLMSAAEAGAVESDGTFLYWTSSTPTRQTIFSYSPTSTATLAVTVSAGDVLKLQNLAVDGYSSLRLYDSGGNGKAAFGYGNASALSFTSQVFINASAVPLIFSISGSEKMRIEATAGRVGIGVAAPTAVLHLKAVTASANTASLKIDAGTLMSAAEAGAVESDGTSLYWTSSTPTRQTIFSYSPTATAALTVTVSANNVLKLQNLAVDGYSTVRMYDSGGNGKVAFGYGNASAASFTGQAYVDATSVPLIFSISDSEKMRIEATAGRVGIGVAAPTAVLHLKAVTASANTASLKIDAGTLMSAAEAGAVESDGTSLYWTSSTPTRQTIFSYSPTATATFAVTVSAGDVIKFQNLAVDGYSTIRLYDSGGGGKAAFGYGNASAASFTGLVYVNASAVPLVFSISGSEKMRLDTSGNFCLGTPTAAAQLTVVQPVATSGLPSVLSVTSGAHTNLTAGSEDVGANLNFSATKQWATGAIATQREVVFQSPTYAFVAASTITTAATVAITGAPSLGANAAITNPLALWVQSGATSLLDPVGVNTLRPSARLHVASTTTTAFLATSATSQLNLTDATVYVDNSNTTANSFSQVLLHTKTGGTDSNVRLVAIGVTTSNTDFAICTSSGGTMNSRIYVGPLGNVGIGPGTQAGTTSRLQVSASTSGTAAAGLAWNGVNFVQSTFSIIGTTTPVTSLNFVTMAAPIVSAASAVVVSDFFTLRLGAATFVGTGPASAIRNWSLGIDGNSTFGGGQSVHTTNVNVAGPYTILQTDYLLNVLRTSTASISLNLPSIATVGDGFMVGAKDAGYNASVNNITWIRNGADTVENVAGNYVQNVTGSTVWLVANATTNNWEIV